MICVYIIMGFNQQLMGISWEYHNRIWNELSESGWMISMIIYKPENSCYHTATWEGFPES